MVQFLRATRRRTGCRASRSSRQARRRSRSARTHLRDPGVRRASAGWFINAKVFRMRSSDTRLEERRLLELHRQSLAQRFVEHRIARPVGEIGEHDGVLVREIRARVEDTGILRPRPPPQLPHPAAASKSGDAVPGTLCGRHSGRHRHRARVSFQALKVGAKVGCVLVTEVAVGLEALRDDALQLWRLLDAESDPSRRTRSRRHFSSTRPKDQRSAR